MSHRPNHPTCARCGRNVPRKRLQDTRAGLLCPRCADHLPKRLRRPARTTTGESDQ